MRLFLRSHASKQIHKTELSMQSEFVPDMDLVQHLENFLESVSQLNLKVLELFKKHAC